MKRYRLLFLISLMSCGLFNSDDSDLDIREKYKIEGGSGIHFQVITYDDFTSKESQQSLIYPVIISRSDCGYCIQFRN